MKKLLFTCICFILCSMMFAEDFNDIKKFDTDSISSFNISLFNENITVETSTEKQIYLIIESKNKSVLPSINIYGKELKICSNDEMYDKNNVCNILLKIPETFIADKVFIKTVLGKLEIKKMTSRTVILNPGPDNSMGNIKSDYFEIPVPDEADINIFNLDSKEINMSLFVGKLNLSLLQIPEKNSKITLKQGKMNVLFPKDAAFTLNTRSFYSKFVNNLDNSTKDWIRDGFTYEHNGGGVEILLQTHTGDIEVSSYSAQ
ncbi:MAG: DUF4097 domain-containing protein [Treponema sp.]|nr:DUF4097 domain-containing protein [Treponema sp.]